MTTDRSVAFRARPGVAAVAAALGRPIAPATGSLDPRRRIAKGVFVWERDRVQSTLRASSSGHALVNHTTAPCRYLVLGNPQPNEVAVFTDTGRVSVKLMGEGYRGSETLEYWEGVDVDAQS